MTIKLANGRGQLGTALKTKIVDQHPKQVIHLYHTWNIDDKTEPTQRVEYNKFKNFVDKQGHEKIIFISTKSEKDSSYVYYKHLAESYLIQNCNKCLVLRFPTIVGSKGTLQQLKYKKIKPYGIMELMSLNEMCEKIIDNLYYTGSSKILSFNGQKITAKLICELLNI